MIIGVVPTQRPKLDWKEYIKSREDFDKVHATGLFYVWWPDLTWGMVEEDLNKEKESVTD